MLEMKITISAADLAAAINNLAAALNGNHKMHSPQETVPVPAATPAVNPTPESAVPMTTPANTPSAPPATMPLTANPTVPVAGVPLSATPAQTAAPMAPTVPVAPSVPAATPAANTTPVPVPTAAPQYTLDMIATAGSALIDAGKMGQLMQLLAKYGVASLTELAPESYGAVASELRALGARI